MQQFVVPQFIDVEDKIFGPITTRQFLILLVAGCLGFVVYKLADLALFAILIALIGGLAIVLAFVKVNGQTFHYFLLNILQTARHPGLRVWKKDYTKSELEYLRKEGTEEKKEEVVVQKVARRERIRDLSLIVNTGGYYKGED